jgi:hypothetical protein
VIAHEVGHAPGRQSVNSDHAELAIMVTGAQISLVGVEFAPQTVRRFRSTASWTR